MEDLGKMSEDYYVLKKRSYIKQGTSINLPEEAEKMLDKVPFEDEEPANMDEENDEEDSNRESNPDYEYPDEESSYSSENEGILH